MYHEDVELSWRARLAGLRVVVDPGADVFHEYEFGRQLRPRSRCWSATGSSSCSPPTRRLLVLLGPVLASESWRCSTLCAAALASREAGRLVVVPRQRALARKPPARDEEPAAGYDRELARFLTPTLDPRMIELPRGAGTFNAVVERYWLLVKKAL